MILYLIRHGKSLANQTRCVTGTPADPLSEEGLKQAAQLAKWLSEAGIEAERYVTSQWGRAQQTARTLWPNARWEIDARVGETDAGDVADWTLDCFQAQYPDFHHNPDNVYPGGESHIDLNRRVLTWLEEQASRPCEGLALVAHSGPISCILQHVLGIGMEHFPAFLPGHASLSVIDISHEGEALSGRLLAFSSGPAANVPPALLSKKVSAQ